MLHFSAFTPIEPNYAGSDYTTATTSHPCGSMLSLHLPPHVQEGQARIHTAASGYPGAALFRL